MKSSLNQRRIVQISENQCSSVLDQCVLYSDQGGIAALMANLVATDYKLPNLPNAPNGSHLVPWTHTSKSLGQTATKIS